MQQEYYVLRPQLRMYLFGCLARLSSHFHTRILLQITTEANFRYLWGTGLCEANSLPTHESSLGKRINLTQL